MAIKNVSDKNKFILWGLSAGRCQYKGCNEFLGSDPVTKGKYNMAYIAHIVATAPGGPRGDKKRSPLLEDELSNLMILCDKHHRLIDVEDVAGHSESVLHGMKSSHEERIQNVAGTVLNAETQLVLFGANIGQQAALLTEAEAKLAVIPDRYPNSQVTKIGLLNSQSTDDEEHYWKSESKNLVRHFEKSVHPLIAEQSDLHISFFGIAPQPLLIKAGTLLGDIRHCDVFQKQREHTPTWSWPAVGDPLDFNIESPDEVNGPVALVFSISATVTDTRVENVLGDKLSIWRVSIESPNNDCVRSVATLEKFRKTIRSLLDQIKKRHGESETIHVFPAMPVSLAVEFGRIWMPKADLPLLIYDQQSATEERGFTPVLEIGL